MLDDYKHFALAISSGKYERVDQIVRVGMGRRLGIRGITALYEQAAQAVYHPRNFTEEDDMRQLLNWRIGGVQIAEIAHRASALPGLSTIRQQSIVRPLVPSPLAPKTSEIVQNLSSCFEGIVDVIRSQKVVHQVLMYDEIATEKRPRWDEKTNQFLGICGEHGNKTSLSFDSASALETLFEDLERNEVHYASEVRVVSEFTHCQNRENTYTC